MSVTLQNGRGAVHLAVYAGRPEVAEVLLSAGANVNAQDNRGGTPLHYAVGQAECAGNPNPARRGRLSGDRGQGGKDRARPRDPDG